MKKEGFLKLKNALSLSNMDDSVKVMMLVTMNVKKEFIIDFENALKNTLKFAFTIPGHISSCVVKPRPGEYVYHTVIKFMNRKSIEYIADGSVGDEFQLLLQKRDAFLSAEPEYKIERMNYGTWIDDTGLTTDMEMEKGDEGHDSCDNPNGLIVQASFILPEQNKSLLRKRYQRNNKRAGQKNLRCFPGCKRGRHVAFGFCGESIKVHVSVSRVTVQGVKMCPFAAVDPNMLAFCRFKPVEMTHCNDISGPEVKPGVTLDQADLEPYIRTKNNPIGPLMPGNLKGSSSNGPMQSAVFEFNADGKAWQYGWVAPRGQGQSSSEIEHVVEIVFLRPYKNRFYCVETLTSTSFGVFSSRRASNQTQVLKSEPRPIPFTNDNDVTKKSKLDANESFNSPLLSKLERLESFEILEDIQAPFFENNFNFLDAAWLKEGAVHLKMEDPTDTLSLSDLDGINQFEMCRPDKDHSNSVVAIDELPWLDLYDIFQ